MWRLTDQRIRRNDDDDDDVSFFGMKITKVPKRKPDTPSDLAELGARIVDEPESSLAPLLDGIGQWTWPRGDLYAWIAVLNRFDDILERICKDTPFEPVQMAPFTQNDRELLLAVLAFTRLLLENCMNRKLYASYEHLNILLATDDQDVLERLLYLVLRPAQQHSSTGRHELPLSQQRLRILASVWPPREAGIELVDVARPETMLPVALHSVHVNGIRRKAPEATAPTGADSVNVSRPSTPAKRADDAEENAQARSLQALVTGLDSTTRSPGELVKSCGAWDELSDDERFELFRKVCVVLAFRDARRRHQALVCRLFAIACFIHAVPESMTNMHLFMVEPSLVLRTAALLEPPHAIDDRLRGAALYALDAFRHFRSRLGDVLTAVNASMSHGVLRQILQCTIQRLCDLATSAILPPSFDMLIDALITLIANLTTVVSGTSMVTGAGVITPLLELACIESTSNYLVQRTSTRAIGLIDSILYSYPATFQQFTAAHGVDVLVQRVDAEMQSVVSSGRTDPLPFGRVQVLRQILRLFHHLMTTSGLSDGPLNLIDTPLLPALRTIMQHKHVFGVQVLAQAISIMATFVHNEPTQLATMQENHMPETFVKALQDDLEPSFELLSAVTTAIGALCLNEVGLRLLMESEVVQRVMRVLNDTRYHRMFLDRDNATVFGTSMDELVRHHPALKEGVLSELTRVMDRLVADAHAFTPPSTEYALGRALYVVDERVHLDAKPIRTSHVTLDEPTQNPPDAVPGDENAPVQAFDVLCRFLDGLFRNVAPCREFVRRGGLAQLFAFYAAPCMSHHFPATPTADSFVMLLRTITEESPSTVLSALLREVKRSMDELHSNFLDVDNVRFRTLVRLYLRVQLLSDVCHTFGQAFAFTESGTNLPFMFLRTLREGGDAATIAQLADLLRFTAWEHLHVKAALEGQTDLSPSIKALQHVVVRIPAALFSMLSIVTRLFMPRRSSNREYIEAAKRASSDLSEVLLAWSHLRGDVPQVDALAEQTYLYLALRHLLYDKRAAHGEQTHTYVLRAWSEHGGDAVLVDQVRHISTFFEHGTLADDETSVTAHAAGVLRVYLDLVLRFVPARTLLDAPQTAQLQKDPSFQPHILLIQLRKHALDILSQLWDAPWLASLPLVPVREVAQSLGMVLYADHEDPPPTEPQPPPVSRTETHLPAGFPSALAATLSSMPMPVRPPPALAVDEGRLAQLVEMGFPRGGARRALERCHNNISAATEYILQHPELEDEPDVAQPEQLARDLAGSLRAETQDDEQPSQPEQEEQQQQQQQQESQSEREEHADQPEEVSRMPSAASSPAAETAVSTEGPSPNKLALEACREKMRPNFFPRLLELADAHEPLVFDARHVFVFFSREQEQVERLWRIVTERITLDASDSRMTTRLHLLALLLTTDPLQAKVPWSTLPRLAFGLLGCIQSSCKKAAEQGIEISPEPAWLASALLALCGIISASEMPRELAAAPGDEQDRQAFLERLRPQIMSFALKALEYTPHLSPGTLLGIGRVLALITRDATTTATLIEKRGVSLIMRPLFTRRHFQRALYQRLIVMVLRHMVESGGALFAMLANELSVWLQLGTRPRPTEVSVMLKALGPSVVRAPATFLDAAASQLDLLDFQSMQSPTHLRPRAGAKLPVEPATAQPVRDAVIHMLLDELVATREGGVQPMDQGDVSFEDARDAYVFTLLQSLVELLSSYMGCKFSFLQYRVQGSTPVLAYFLDHLVPSGFLAQYEQDELRKRMTESNWSISVLVALATDPLPSPDAESVPEPLVTVRKTLLDALHKALREAITTHEMIEVKFGRLYALSDMCYRLLNARPNTGTAAPRRSEVVLHMAKTMLEKNFVPLLTHALADLDVNMPSLSSLLDSVLRPLEHLAKVAIKMARSDKHNNRRHHMPEHGEHAEADVAGDAGDDDDDDDDDDDSRGEMRDDDSFAEEEEDDAPDFYRNSSLGMHTGEMEQGAYDSDALSDELDEEDIEMEEYNSDEAESELSTDAEGLDGDSAHVVEVMDEDDEDEDDDDDVDDDDDDDADEASMDDAMDEQMEDSLSEEMLDDDEEFDDDELDVEGFDYVLDEDDDAAQGEGGVDEILEALDDMEDPGAGDLLEHDHANDSGDEGGVYEARDVSPLHMPDDLAWHPRVDGDRFGANWSWTQQRSGRRGAQRSQGPPTFFSVLPATGPATQDAPRRPPPSAQENDTAFHPLLVDGHSLDREREAPGWPRSMEALMGENTMQFLEMFLQQNVPNGADASIRIELDQGRGMPRMQITNIVGNTSMLRPVAGSAGAGSTRMRDTPSQPAPFDATAESLRFTPLNTQARRGEEAQLVLGAASPDLNAAFRRPVIELLLPEYHARREREEKERAAAEEVRQSESKRKLRDVEEHEGDEHAHRDRVTVSVNGETVDLTDTGIDPTFLEALPDELREEALISQQLSAQLARQSRRIVPDFLDVLPHSLRAELQHVDEPNTQNEEPARRSSREAHGQQPHTERERRHPSQQHETPSSAAEPTQPASSREAQPQGRDAIQLLDRSSLASLVRLLFLPHINTRATLLHKLFAHLCENGKTRTELLGMLLMVLWDSMHSTSFVDRSFAALCNKAAKHAHTPQRSTPRGAQQQSMTGSGILPPPTPSAMPFPLTWMGEEAPYLIASRSLELLTYLTHVNSQAALYFLREDRTRKGHKRIPVQILLGLLEKDAVLEHAPLMNALLALLQSVTKPLSTAHTAPDDGGVVLDKMYGEIEAPSLSPERLAAIVRPLNTPMSSREFQHTLAVSAHLAKLPGAHEVLSMALQRAAKRASDMLTGDLDAVIASLPPPKLDNESDEMKVDTQASSASGGAAEAMATDTASADAAPHNAPSTSLPLAKLASPTSAQAEFLRCLRALDYLYLGK